MDNEVHTRLTFPLFQIKKNKKTVKLFWKEVRDDPISQAKLKSGYIWDELTAVTVDTQKLEHLFESRAKDLISKVGCFFNCLSHSFVNTSPCTG